MRFAVNYSEEGAELWRQGLIQVDCFKCPAWPSLIDELHNTYPLYVHFPLRVGMGIGDAINTETQQKPDWESLAALASQTRTPYFNVHLAPIPEDHPEIPAYQLGRDYSDQLAGYMVQDIQSIVDRFGGDKVIAENIYAFWGEHPKAAIIPEVVRDVIQDTGCGLLLDLSHVRQAARELEMDPKDYINILPVRRLREVHMTGIQILDDAWLEKLRRGGLDVTGYQKYLNQPLDHLPMVEDDWVFFQWAMEQIQQGCWQEPEIVAFEYSGVGKGFFQATTDSSILLKQVPRLYTMVHEKLGPDHTRM